MTKVLIPINLDSRLNTEINLSDLEWSSLDVDNLPPFKIEELRRPCNAYKDGIFPGAESNGKETQISKICKFTNYIEFCKVMGDEVAHIAGQSFLTTKFYDRRKVGWDSIESQYKLGEVIGYCINGDVYNVADDQVNKVFYDTVYYSLIEKNPKLEEIQRFIKDGICVTLSGVNKNILTYLSKIILRKVAI